MGSNRKAIRKLEVTKSTFYKWKKAFDKDGPKGLLGKYHGL
ncbi:helix-turn-helix domain-containing protein [Spongiimicrobium sp. 2-473A-2-J]